MIEFAADIEEVELLEVGFVPSPLGVSHSGDDFDLGCCCFGDFINMLLER